MIGMKKQMGEWNQLDRGFDNEREGRFLQEMMAAMEAQDADGFAQIAANWDQMTKMEDWMVTVLLVAKKHAEPDEAEDEFA
jgi:Soluble NSF attachment protein, SNAP